MISVEMSFEPDSNWNQRLIDNQLGNMLQTKEFGFSKELIGSKPVFLKFFGSDDKIIGQLLALSYSKFEKKGKFGKILKMVSGKKDNICRWFYGPVIFDNNYELEINQELRNFLISKNFNIWGSEHPLSNRNFASWGKPFEIENWATFLIDLSQEKNLLWEKMDKHSARKNIERSQKRNVVVKKMNKTDLPIYLEMMKGTRENDLETSLTIMEKQWDLLNSIGYSGFMAFENDTPIGGIRVSSFNGYIYEFGIARTKRDFTEKLYSQDLLKWKIIEWGIENKLRYYDLSGINPKPKNKKEEGIFRYKEKWGGKLYPYTIVKYN